MGALSSFTVRGDFAWHWLHGCWSYENFGPLGRIFVKLGLSNSTYFLLGLSNHCSWMLQHVWQSFGARCVFWVISYQLFISYKLQIVLCAMINVVEVDVSFFLSWWNIFRIKIVLLGLWLFKCRVLGQIINVCQYYWCIGDISYFKWFWYGVCSVVRHHNYT